jgi:hypothetical protein
MSRYKLDEHQGFEAMRLFLRAYYERTKPGSFPVLLSDIEQESDGMPHDPAAWEDWLACLSRVIRDE